MGAIVSASEGVDPHILTNTGRKVWIRNKLTHAMHVPGNVAKNLVPVTIWSEQTDGSNPDLQWTISTAPAGGYFIESALDSSFVLHQTM